LRSVSSTDRLARGPWEAGIAWQASYGGLQQCARRLSAKARAPSNR